MGERVTLGVYVPYLDPQPTGLGRYVHETCSRLSAASQDLQVFLQGGSAPWAGAEAESVWGGRLRGPLRRAVRLAWLGARPGPIDASGVDVLFCPSQEAPLRRTSTPVCLVVHDLTALRIPGHGRRGDRLQTRILLRRMASLATAVIAVSESTRRDLVDLLGVAPQKIAVIPEGVDHGLYYPRSAEDVADTERLLAVQRRYILYAGTLSKHKNVPLLLRLVAHLRHEGRELELVITGRQPPRDVGPLLALAKNLGIESQVRFVGYQPLDRLASLMSGCTAFVYPSFYEGFGLAVLEAMACGAPVVASDRASLPEVVGDGGTLLPPRDLAGWVRAIHQLVDDKSHRETARQASFERAATFDWERCASMTSEILCRVTGGHYD